eukprot:m.464070 g.464070  ORF g.464070 m.464070 type:complete len:345 (-) comp23301_c0_seq1:64-1098(-)
MSEERLAAAAPPPPTVMVASLQASSDLGKVEENTAKFIGLAEEAAAAGAKIIVLPETAITGYLSQDLTTNWIIPSRKRRGLKNYSYTGEMDPALHAETVPGPSTRRFCELAKRLGVYITVPFLEVATEQPPPTEVEEDDGSMATDAAPIARYYNTVCLAGPDGTLRAHYRKTSPWPTPEKSWATAGTDVAFADTEYGRVGLAICFDIHSVLAKYAQHELWALLYPIAWVGEPEQWFRTELPGLLRKVNSNHYIIGCNWSTDEEQSWPGAGISSHYGPRGELVASTGDQIGSTIVYSTIFTAPHAPQVGSLDLAEYAKWTVGVGGQSADWAKVIAADAETAKWSR